MGKLTDSAERSGARGQSESGAAVRALTIEDQPQLYALLDQHPINGVFIQGHLAERPTFFSSPHGPSIIGRFHGQRLVDVCWLGANAVPLDAQDSGELWARYANRNNFRPVSIFGPQRSALAMWQHYQSSKEPFAIRDNQPLLATSSPPRNTTPHPDLRQATRADLPQLFPAAVAMFTEEVGYSPVANGSRSYEERIADRIDRGYSYLLTDPKTQDVIFKAELGNVSAQVAQINGVWVAPQHRGAGIAQRCLTAVVIHALGQVDTVSLYVNHYNTPALRLYRKLGFEQIGTFATILL